MSRRRLPNATAAMNAVRRFRTNFLFGTLLLLFALLLGRLGKLQLIDAGRFQAEADRKHAGAYRFQPHRGRIVDRHGHALATPKPARRVGLDPSEILDPRRFALVLSDYLAGMVPAGHIRATVQEALAKARAQGRAPPQYRMLLPYVDDPSVVARLDDLNALSLREKRRQGVYGVVIEMEEGRHYPNGAYAAHVLGQMPQDDARPGTGAEQAYDHILSGEETEVLLRRDGRRRPYARSGLLDRSASRGGDVALTLDITIQHFLEKALDDLVDRWRPTHACGIVLDPHSGEILALGNRPAFDPNSQPANANTAIQGLYEPGSFFKPFTVAWALRHAVVGPDEVIDMPEHTTLPGDPHPIRDTHHVGPGDVRTLLAQSSNTGAALLAHRLGRERMRGLFEHLFPAGQHGTGCGLPYEKSARPRKQRWAWWMAHRAGFGQGFSVTPMQMAASFAAFARQDGRQVRPTIQLADASRSVAGATVCHPLHLPVIRAGLERCASEGTARRVFADCAWRVGAKTATAQQRGMSDGYALTFHNCSLAAYAPAGRPQVVVLVLAQVPAGNSTYGGTVAGPAVRNVIEKIMHYWNVPADAHAAVLAAAPTRGEVR